MAQLSPAEIAAHLRAAGVPEDKLPVMTAIGLAESGGRATAHNPNASTGDNSYGIFQVNMLGDMGPERRKQFGISRNEDLFDPAINARAASQILGSQGLGAWSVYKSGDYKRFLDQAQQGVAGAGTPAAAPAPAATSTATPTAAGFDVSKLFEGTAPGSGEASLNRMAAAGIEAMNPWLTLSEPTRKAASSEFLQAAGDTLSPQKDPFLSMLGDLLGGGTGDTALTTTKPSAPAARPATAAAGGGALGIVDVGKTLEAAGLRVRENPHFGDGKVGRHSPKSLHYVGGAIDVTDHRKRDDKFWPDRKAFLGRQIAEILGPNAEVFHPGNDPKGHGSHIHIGLRNGGWSAEQLQRIAAAERESVKRYPLG